MSDMNRCPRRKVIMHAHRCPETDAPLFWSNEQGWVDLAAATVFAVDEKVQLPYEAWGTLELPGDSRPCRDKNPA